DHYVPRYVSWMNDPTGANIPDRYTIKLERGTPIGAQIQNEQGQPIPGASIEFLSILRDYSNIFQDNTDLNGIRLTSDEQGRWRYDDGPANTDYLMINVSHPDYLRAQTG